MILKKLCSYLSFKKDSWLLFSLDIIVNSTQDLIYQKIAHIEHLCLWKTYAHLMFKLITHPIDTSFILRTTTLAEKHIMPAKIQSNIAEAKTLDRSATFTWDYSAITNPLTIINRFSTRSLLTQFFQNKQFLCLNYLHVIFFGDKN